MKVSTAISKRILELCAQKNITVELLSAQSNVSQLTINNIVSGKTEKIGIVTIKSLCDAFNISLKDFFDTETFRTLEQEIE